MQGETPPGSRSSRQAVTYPPVKVQPEGVRGKEAPVRITVSAQAVGLSQASNGQPGDANTAVIHAFHSQGVRSRNWWVPWDSPADPLHINARVAQEARARSGPNPNPPGPKTVAPGLPPRRPEGVDPRRKQRSRKWWPHWDSTDGPIFSNVRVAQDPRSMPGLTPTPPGPKGVASGLPPGRGPPGGSVPWEGQLELLQATLPVQWDEMSERAAFLEGPPLPNGPLNGVAAAAGDPTTQGIFSATSATPLETGLPYQQGRAGHAQQEKLQGAQQESQQPQVGCPGLEPVHGRSAAGLAALHMGVSKGPQGAQAPVGLPHQGIAADAASHLVESAGGCGRSDGRYGGPSGPLAAPSNFLALLQRAAAQGAPAGFSDSTSTSMPHRALMEDSAVQGTSGSVSVSNSSSSPHTALPPGFAVQGTPATGHATDSNSSSTPQRDLSQGLAVQGTPPIIGSSEGSNATQGVVLRETSSICDSTSTPHRALLQDSPVPGTFAGYHNTESSSTSQAVPQANNGLASRLDSASEQFVEPVYGGVFLHLGCKRLLLSR
jgi:hypothetical protein